MLTKCKTVAIISSGLKRCGFSSSGRARPCQGRGSEFKPRNPLQIYAPNTYVWGVNSIWRHSQEVRQRSAKPRFTSPNLVVASIKLQENFLELLIYPYSICKRGSFKAAIGLYEKYGFKFYGEKKKLSPYKEIYEYKYVYQSKNI